MGTRNLTYHLINPLIGSPKIDTNLLWDLTSLFIGLGVLYFLFVFFFRNKISSNSVKVGQRKRELSPMISEFLFYEENASKEEKSHYIALKIEIRELLKDDFNRRVLSEILLDLQRDVSGNTEYRLFKLYQDLRLHLDAFQKLKSWRWEVVSKGILELTQMQVIDAYPFITKFINDKRGIIRKQSEIATVTLKNEGINYFLDTTKHKISEWQQLKLLEVIRNLENFEPPRFKAWLTSSNKDVVLFALRLIKYYDQNDANNSIVQLVKHKNNKIKEEAINCIKKFCVFEALDSLKDVFWKCNVDIKVLILDAIASFGKENDVLFLKSVENRESNFIIKSKAISAINVIAPETIMPTKGIEEITIKNTEKEENTTVPKTMVEEVNIKEPIAIEDKIDSSTIDVVLEAEIKIENENLLEIKVFDPEIFNEPQKDEMDDILMEFEKLPEETNIDDDTIEIDFLPLVVVENKEILTTEELNFDEDTLSKSSKNIFDNNFFEQDNYNKILLLDTIEDLGSAKDIPFIKEIVEKEENELIKERALEILNNFSKTTYYFNEEEKTLEENVDSGHSIFKKLFNSCDEESKLLLLEEILEIGDSKEISFLNTLLSHKDKKIKEKAKAVKIELKKRAQFMDVTETNKVRHFLDENAEFIFPLPDDEIALIQTIEYKSAIIEKKAKVEPFKSKKLIPMEFSFLLDELEIKLAGSSSIFDIDFELTNEFYKKQEPLKRTNKNKKK